MERIQQIIASLQKLTPCVNAIAFARVSKREQANGASHDAQLNAIRQYCANKSLNIIQEIKLVESSTRGERKEFHKMLESIKKSKTKTAIVVHCIDRFQRSFKESSEIDKMLKADLIEVHFYKEGLILNKNSNSADIMRWDMGILSGKMYVNALRDNVKRSMDYNWSSGKWQGLAPTGYLNTIDAENKKTIVIDAVRGPLVKKMFEDFSTGLYSLTDMEIWAKKHNLLSRRPQKGVISPLTRTTIFQMFKNPFYYGEMKVKNILIPHVYEPLIDKCLFDKVQNVLSGKSTIHNKSQYRSLDFALRGLFRCAKCGATMSPEVHTKSNGKQYIYLKCVHRHNNCDQKPINEASVLQQIESELTGNLTFSEQGVTALKSIVKKYLKEEVAFEEKHKNELEAKLNQINTRLSNATDLLLDGVLSKEIFDVKVSQLKKEKEDTEKEL